MCGRIQIRLNAREAASAFQAEVRCDDSAFERFNAAPSQQLPLLRPAADGGGRDGGLELVASAWGFPAPWDEKLRPINARSETAAKSRLFGAAWKSRRVALPVTGFYEWQKPDADDAPPLFGGEAEAGRKIPWLIEAAEGEPFALAGLANESGFCVLTTAPNEAMKRIHNRMPVVLPADALERWLDRSSDPDELEELTAPRPADTLRFTAIDDRINKPSNDSPSAVEPLAEPVDGATFAAPAA